MSFIKKGYQPCGCFKQFSKATKYPFRRYDKWLDVKCKSHKLPDQPNDEWDEEDNPGHFLPEVVDYFEMIKTPSKWVFS